MAINSFILQFKDKMLLSENKKAITLKNLMGYTIANSSNFTYVTNLISRTKEITVKEVGAYTFRDLKVLPVALGILRNFYLYALKLCDLPDNHVLHIHLQLHGALMRLMEYAIYIDHEAFAEMITNKMYLVINDPKSPKELAKMIINAAPKNTYNGVPWTAATKNNVNRITYITNEPKNIGYFNKKMYGNNKKQKPKSNKRFKQSGNQKGARYIDPKNCKFCRQGNCYLEYHHEILKARAR